MDSSSTLPLLSGNSMPVMGLGTWQLKHDTAGVVAAALQAGYRLVDTSGDYGTQPGVGEGIRRSGIDRQDIFLVTKVEEDDDAYQATVNDLDELKLEYADLMLIHRPPKDGSDEELWKGLIRAKQEGLARDIGVSNYSIGRIQQLMDATGEMPVVNQIEWTPFGHSHEMYDFCKEHGIIIQAYSPLTRQERLGNDVLQQLANKYRKTPAQILIRWNLQNQVVPLPKANQRDHLLENLDVFDFEIDSEDMISLDGLNEHYSSLGTLPYV